MAKRKLKTKRKPVRKTTRSRWAALPKSKATTAYELLDEIKAVIKAEPKRYNQIDTLTPMREDYPNITQAKRDYHTVPTCGTVGCVAGWVIALREPGALFESAVVDRAANILGLMRTSYLFNGSAAAGAPQSRAHAESGVEHITHFQERYEDNLKGHILPPILKPERKAKRR